ncbi:MAG: helix-turn-helix transcriptional regulator [Pseudomonadota bacterium]
MQIAVDIGYNRAMDPDYKDVIRDALSRKRLSMKTASTMAGLSETYVRDLLKRDMMPAADKFFKLAEVLEIDPNILNLQSNHPKPSTENATPVAARRSTHNSEIGKIDRKLLIQIVTSIEETRRTRKIAIGGKTPQEYANFLTDVYNLCLDAGGSFDAVRHFVELDTLDRNTEEDPDKTP